MTGYIIFNASDRLLTISDSLRAGLGYDVDDELPQVWGQLFVDDSDAFKLTANKSQKRVAYLSEKSGRILEAMLQVIRLDGSVNTFIADVTAVDEAGDIERSVVDSASHVFLTTVSHELRSSLNSVIGLANTLGGSDLNPDQNNILEKIQSRNFALKGLINDILEFSRIEASDMDFQLEEVELAGFVREIVGLFYERSQKKGLKLEAEIMENLPDSAMLSRLRVMQVLSNLISNAIKFTDAGCVSISVSVEESMVKFQVLDTGSGVPSASKGRIFEPFIQAEESSQSEGGFGLGLAISKSLADKMGGTLFFESPLPGGSLFVLKLPFVSANSELPKERSLSKLPSTKVPLLESVSKVPRHILIVEDNQLNADILSHFLKEYGATFDVVDNGKAAVDVYEDGKYDLILMDVMLPEMNGYEATELILSRSKRSTVLPIIGVTAKVFRRDQVRCLESGMVEVVHKPVDFMALGLALDRHLYGQQKQPAPAVPESKYISNPHVEPAESIDTKVLNDYMQRMDSDSSNSIEIVDTALRIMDKEVDLLIKSIEKGEKEAVSFQAHSLKGALALLGSRDLLDLVKALESIASQEDNVVRAEHWKVLIVEEYKLFKGSIKSYLA